MKSKFIFRIFLCLFIWPVYFQLHAQRLNGYLKPYSSPKTKSQPANYSSNTAILTPVWNYQLQPVVTRMEYGASPAMIDLGAGVNNLGGEPDNFMEIITGSDEYANFYPELNSDAYGIWRCFDANGNLEWASDTKSDEAKSSVSVADIDYDLHPEIAGGTTSGWCLEVMNRFGSWTGGVPDASWTFPYQPQRNGSFMWHSSPAMGELITGPNHEGLEVVGGNNPKMNIWALDGDNTDGVNDGITADLSDWFFPGETGTEGVDWDVLWVFQTSGSIIASPAIGDIDGDSHNEVICGSKDDTLYCLNGQNGTLKWKLGTGGMITSSAGIADFNNDGKAEVVVGSQDNYVYFIKGDINGNGMIDSAEYTRFSTQGPVLSSPAIADFDADGHPDVIIGSDDGKIYGLFYNPATNTVSEEWHYQTGNTVRSSPAVANSGRNMLTIYVGSSDSLLYVLNGNGSLITTYNAGGEVVTSPSVADIDGDSRLEIAFTAWTEPDHVIVLRDAGSNVTPFSSPWPMFRHDSRHTGCYTWAPPVYNCDAGVEEIISPEGSMPGGTIIVPRVEVHNFGETTAASFTVTFEIRNETNILIYSNTQTVTNLPSDSSRMVSFLPLTATPGQFHTKSYTYLGCDGEPDDNAEYGSYHVIQSQWILDFETNDGNFSPNTSPGGWEWGVPASGPMAAYSGIKVWATVLNGNYSDSVNWILSSGNFISHQHHPVVSFYHWYNFENLRDGGNLKISVNGGTPVLVYPEGGYPGIATWNNYGIPDQPCFTGISGGWILSSFELPVDSGQQFSLQWCFGSDNINNRPGWYIDNVMGNGFGPGLNVTVTATPILCSGDLSEVTVTAGGGTPPYSGTGIFNLPAGYYNFNVTDSAGISGSGGIFITEPDLLTATIIAQPTACTGVTSTLTAIPAGGTPDYSYYWNDGSVTQSIFDALPGIYSVTVYDLYGCSAVAEFTLAASAPASVNISASANPVNSGTTVVFTATPVNGGLDPVYEWYVNNSVSGNNTSIFTYTPSDGDIVFCTMYTSDGCVVNSNEIIMVVGGIPATLNLQNINILNNMELCYDATQTITVAGNGSTFLVHPGGKVTLIAGQKIKYMPGVKVYSGGKMKGKIASNGEYCNNKSALLTTEQSGNPSIERPGRYRVYPNPVAGNFTLEILAANPEEIFSVEIFNTYGVMIRTVGKIKAGKHGIEFTDVPDGLYVIRIENPVSSGNIRVIKTR